MECVQWLYTTTVCTECVQVETPHAQLAPLRTPCSLPKTYASRINASPLTPKDEDPNEAIYEALTPFYNGGHDRDGRPIHWERTGVYNLPKVFKLLTPEDLVQRHIREQAIALENMEVRCMDCGVAQVAVSLVPPLATPRTRSSLSLAATEKVRGARAPSDAAGRHHGPQRPVALAQLQGPGRLS